MFDDELHQGSSGSAPSYQQRQRSVGHSDSDSDDSSPGGAAISLPKVEEPAAPALPVSPPSNITASSSRSRLPPRFAKLSPEERSRLEASASLLKTGSSSSHVKHEPSVKLERSSSRRSDSSSCPYGDDASVAGAGTPLHRVSSRPQSSVPLSCTRTAAASDLPPRALLSDVVADRQHHGWNDALPTTSAGEEAKRGGRMLLGSSRRSSGSTGEMTAITSRGSTPRKSDRGGSATPKSATREVPAWVRRLSSPKRSITLDDDVVTGGNGFRSQPLYTSDDLHLGSKARQSASGPANNGRDTRRSSNGGPSRPISGSLTSIARVLSLTTSSLAAATAPLSSGTSSAGRHRAPIDQRNNDHRRSPSPAMSSYVPTSYSKGCLHFGSATPERTPTRSNTYRSPSQPTRMRRSAMKASRPASTAPRPHAITSARINELARPRRPIRCGSQPTTKTADIPLAELKRLMALTHDEPTPQGTSRLDLSMEEDAKAYYRQQYVVDAELRTHPSRRPQGKTMSGRDEAEPLNIFAGTTDVKGGTNSPLRSRRARAVSSHVDPVASQQPQATPSSREAAHVLKKAPPSQSVVGARQGARSGRSGYSAVGPREPLKHLEDHLLPGSLLPRAAASPRSTSSPGKRSIATIRRHFAAQPENPQRAKTPSGRLTAAMTTQSACTDHDIWSIRQRQAEEAVPLVNGSARRGGWVSQGKHNFAPLFFDDAALADSGWRTGLKASPRGRPAEVRPQTSGIPPSMVAPPTCPTPSPRQGGAWATQPVCTGRPRMFRPVDNDIFGLRTRSQGRGAVFS